MKRSSRSSCPGGAFDRSRCDRAEYRVYDVVGVSFMAMQWIRQTEQFIRQVRDEVGKIVWPTRRDVILTSIIVSIIALMVSVFLLVVDQGVISLLRFVI